MRKRNTVAKVGKQVASFSSEGAPVKLSEGHAPATQASAPYQARAPPLDHLLTVDEAAAILRCSKASLDKWRLNGLGPKFVYVGRRVRYTREALADFIANSTRNSTSDNGKARGEA